MRLTKGKKRSADRAEKKSSSSSKTKGTSAQNVAPNAASFGFAGRVSWKVLII